MHLIFATRPSALARWQTQWVMKTLQQAWPGLDCEEKIITTQGDRVLDRPLPEIGGKGLFTQELEAELTSGRAHAAVHSLKDLPIDDLPGLVTAAIPARADARDALISAGGQNLANLPQGARVGTSSLRRAGQILARRPDLQIEPLRGNVDTRLRKVRESLYDAILLAGAGLIRLGLASEITEWLPLEVMLPAPGQGALAVQCRAEDTETLQCLSILDDDGTRRVTAAERSFLQGLGGGCSLPVAAYGRIELDQIELQGLAISPDGKKLVRVIGFGREPAALGAELAELALAQHAGEFIHA